MHDIGFDHFHPDAEEQAHLSGTIWNADNVELVTLGFDIGSTTTHLAFSKIHLQRLATGLSSRFVVSERHLLWQSPVTLTPYRADGPIDSNRLKELFAQWSAEAGMDRADVDSGAVILTGEALKRENAHAIADYFAEDSGKFVCASAGHHMEATLAAHGSGAVQYSRRRGNTVLNVDVGGGTTKFALIQDGLIVATTAIALGGRVMIFDVDGAVVGVADSARKLATTAGFVLEPGKPLATNLRRIFVEAMSGMILSLVCGEPPDDAVEALMLTDPLPADMALDAVTFSGGVSEYLFGREDREFGDLGADLAHALKQALSGKVLPCPVWDTGEGIRATVHGASQFTVQVSGNTVYVADAGLLPIRNLPVLRGRFDMGPEIHPPAITRAVTAALRAHDLSDGVPLTALAFAWSGDPSHERLLAVAGGIADALPRTLQDNGALILLINGDVGMSLGHVFQKEVAPAARIIAIDGVDLQDFDYVDIGVIRRPAGVIPLVIKSLLF